MWYVIIHPNPNFNCSLAKTWSIAVEVRAWMSDYIPFFCKDAIIWL